MDGRLSRVRAWVSAMSSAMIIDCHCHAGKGDGLTGPWDTNAPLAKYLRAGRRAGIDRTGAVSPPFIPITWSPIAKSRGLSERPDRFYGFAFVHPQRDCGRVAAMVEETVTRHGFVGIKAHRHDAPITREVCEAARASRCL